MAVAGAGTCATPGRGLMGTGPVGIDGALVAACVRLLVGAARGLVGEPR